MKEMVHISNTMERICPDAILVDYTNPMHKVCDAITTLSNTRCIGLCHGVWMGMEQVSYILDKPVDEIEMEACGTERPCKKQEQNHQHAEEEALSPSGRLASPI